MRARIVGLVVGIAVLTVALFGIPLAVGLWRYVLADEQTHPERHADAMAIAVEADVVRNDPVNDPEGIGGIEVAVYDEDGARIAGQGPRGWD